MRENVAIQQQKVLADVLQVCPPDRRRRNLILQAGLRARYWHLRGGFTILSTGIRLNSSAMLGQIPRPPLYTASAPTNPEPGT